MLLWKRPSLSFDQIRTNGGALEIIANLFPFVVSVSNHETTFSDAMVFDQPSSHSSSLPASPEAARRLLEVRRGKRVCQISARDPFPPSPEWRRFVAGRFCRRAPDRA